MDIILPNIGETVDEGKVIKWLKQQNIIYQIISI